MPTKTVVDLEKEYYELFASGASVPGVAVADYVYDSDTSTAGGACTSVIPAVAGKRNYLLGFSITTTAPAAISTGVATVTGLGVTLSYQVVETTTAGAQVHVNFANPLPASALNTAITLTLPAITGGGSVATVIYGYVK